jgi:hypothetical protein
MRALVYHGPGQKAWEEVPDPEITDDGDAIVRVDATTICGTDLHILPGSANCASKQQVQAMAVVAHAQHGRLALVAEITDALPALLTALTADPEPSADKPAASYPGLPGWGPLLALAMTDLDRAQRAGDERAARSGARMIALAERFGFGYGFPAMSAARARRAAQDADGPAYADAVSSYAGLDPEALRAATRAALRARAQVSG